MLQVQFRAKCDTKFSTLYLASLDRLFDIQMREGAGASVSTTEWSLGSGAVTDENAAAAAIVTSLEARASLYYTASLASLERLERGAAQKEPSVRLLQAAGNTPTMAEMEKMKEAANFFLACQKMHQGLNGEALEAFKAIKTPYSSFYTGEIYKKMALEEKASIGVHDNGGLGAAGRVEKLSTSPWRGIALVRPPTPWTASWPSTWRTWRPC